MLKKYKVTIARDARFVNHITMMAETIEDANRQADALVRAMAFDGRALELSMLGPDENPDAYMSLGDPKPPHVMAIIRKEGE